MSLTVRGRRNEVDEAFAPPCPECAVELLPVGAGSHLYWSCPWCSTTMRRS